MTVLKYCECGNLAEGIDMMLGNAIHNRARKISCEQCSVPLIPHNKVLSLPLDRDTKQVQKFLIAVQEEVSWHSTTYKVVGAVQMRPGLFYSIVQDGWIICVFNPTLGGGLRLPYCLMDGPSCDSKMCSDIWIEIVAYLRPCWSSFTQLSKMGIIATFAILNDMQHYPTVKQYPTFRSAVNKKIVTTGTCTTCNLSWCHGGVQFIPPKISTTHVTPILGYVLRHQWRNDWTIASYMYTTNSRYHVL